MLTSRGPSARAHAYAAPRTDPHMRNIALSRAVIGIVSLVAAECLGEVALTPSCRLAGLAARCARGRLTARIDEDGRSSLPQPAASDCWITLRHDLLGADCSTDDPVRLARQRDDAVAQ